MLVIKPSYGPRFRKRKKEDQLGRADILNLVSLWPNLLVEQTGADIAKWTVRSGQLGGLFDGLSVARHFGGLVVSLAKRES